MVARAAFDTSVSLWSVAEIELPPRDVVALVTVSLAVTGALFDALSAGRKPKCAADPPGLRGMIDRVAAVAALILLALPAQAEEVDVRHRGRLGLDAFDCSAVESSFIRRVCYDEANRYMLIQLGSTWYHYCNVPDETVTALIEAESAGRYFNGNVRGKFDCRANQAPRY